MFHEPVELVQIDVREELGCQISKRKAFSRLRMETPDDFRKQAEGVDIPNMLTQDSEQDIVVDGGEEFLHVAFEYPDSPGMVMGHLPEKFLKSIKRLVNPLPIPTGIRIGDEQSVEERVQNTIHGPVYHPVPHARLVDMPWFRVGNIEGFVARVSIRFMSQFLVYRKDIVPEMKFKLRYVFSFAFSLDELLPGPKEIFGRGDMMIIDRYSYFFRMSSSNTPPPQFSPCCNGSKLFINCGKARSHIFQNFIDTRLEEKSTDFFLRYWRSSSGHNT